MHNFHATLKCNLPTADDLDSKQKVTFEQKSQMSNFVDSVQLEISLDALNQGEQAIMKEIALKLYDRNIFTFGQARRLANLSVWEFQQLLGEHNIQRHYSETELVEDIETIKVG